VRRIHLTAAAALSVTGLGALVSTQLPLDARAASVAALPAVLAAAEVPVRAADRQPLPASSTHSTRQVRTFDDAELRRRVQTDPETLGSLSIGKSNRGALYNALRMPEGPMWHLAEPEKSWGTRETIDGLALAIRRVNEEFPGTPEVWIGHISARRGGWLRPHRSHQSGCDVDLGFYYSDDSRWYTKATESNLDRARTWVLLRTLIRDADVEAVFLDRSIQRMLYDHALGLGENIEWLDEVFAFGEKRSERIVRHEWGHATHMHVRFASRTSKDLGQRVHPLLIQNRLMPRSRYY
jgi:murein endopeptidase